MAPFNASTKCVIDSQPHIKTICNSERCGGGCGVQEVKESIIKDQLVACGISKRVKISGAATNMHNKRRAEETCQWVGY